MDCDSFVLSSKTDDLTEDLIEIQEEKDLFDFVKIDKDHPDIVIRILMYLVNSRLEHLMQDM